ncbi:THAP domain-containing protein 3 isoform X6 [Dermochelys coriacea]|uniref:THAP domain-containing protein 3 isoform X6 n=1 Tax=Dermochelys coriacea TaxID=27794 RepID=UPI001CAA1B17|nr:THAP domain-containing protein 3 isoform X6 [Dermochelys coriacea]
MPKSCAALRCSNRYSSRRRQQLTFHRFPLSRPELLARWVGNIGRGDFQPSSHTVLCSQHFQPDCFSAFGNRTNLKPNAVPTLFTFPHTVRLSERLSQTTRETDCVGKSAEVTMKCSQELTAPLQILPEKWLFSVELHSPADHSKEEMKKLPLKVVSKIEKCSSFWLQHFNKAEAVYAKLHTPDEIEELNSIHLHSTQSLKQ